MVSCFSLFRISSSVWIEWTRVAILSSSWLTKTIVYVSGANPISTIDKQITLNGHGHSCQAMKVHAWKGEMQKCNYVLDHLTWYITISDFTFLWKSFVSFSSKAWVASFMDVSSFFISDSKIWSNKTFNGFKSCLKWI